MTSTSLIDSLSVLIPVIILVLVWLAPIAIALSRLNKRNLEETAKAVWVLVILLLPLIGPVTYLLINNGNRNADKQ